jgi:methyltransferase family protein
MEKAPQSKMRPFPRLAYVARANRAIAGHPYEGIERVLERITERRDRRRAPWPYVASQACEEQVHAQIGEPWPCKEHDGFDDVWDGALAELEARGIHVGRGTFGGWDDGDPKLARVAWCLTRHLRPARVVETGVGHGLTTRVLLEALERSGRGHLWSIDLPPLLEHRFADETGVAVPERLRKRWTLLHGSSRRRLPALLASLRQVDLFLHDSMHTTRNLRFELDRVWPALAPGGAVLIDDVDKNVATGQFVEAHPGVPCVMARSEDGQAMIGCVVKPGSFP